MALSYFEQSARYFARPHEHVPREPIEAPAAWCPADFAELPVERLSEAEQLSIEQAAVAALECGRPMVAVERADVPLPGLEERLADWTQTLRAGRGFVLIRGLPVERWPLEVTEMATWILGQHIGEAGPQNPQGETLGHVRDYDEEAVNPMVRRYRTTGNIDFHCDGADVVGLLCLRTAKRGGQSRIASSVTIFNHLLAEHPELAPRLFSSMYLDRRDEEKPGADPCAALQPACYSAERGLSTFYHSEYYRSAARHPGFEPDREALALLDAYDDIASRDSVYLDMWLQPGDLQLVSNHTVVHARTAYVDHEDPELKRHLLRLWLSYRTFDPISDRISESDE